MGWAGPEEVGLILERSGAGRMGGAIRRPTPFPQTRSPTRRGCGSSPSSPSLRSVAPWIAPAPTGRVLSNVDTHPARAGNLKRADTQRETGSK